MRKQRRLFLAFVLFSLVSFFCYWFFIRLESKENKGYNPTAQNESGWSEPRIELSTEEEKGSDAVIAQAAKMVLPSNKSGLAVSTAEDAILRVVGRVVDSEGRGVPDVFVGLTFSSKNRRSKREEYGHFIRQRRLRRISYKKFHRSHPKTGRDGRFVFQIKRRTLSSRPRFFKLSGPVGYEIKLLELDKYKGRSNIDLGDISLNRQAFIRGRVVDSFGAAVHGARITFRREESSTLENRLPNVFKGMEEQYGFDSAASVEKGTMSDSDGNFIIPHLSESVLSLRVYHDDFCFIPDYKVHLSRLKEHRLEILMERPRALNIVVQDVMGQAQEGVKLTIEPNAGYPQIHAREFTETSNEKGLARFAKIQSARFYLRVEKPGFVSYGRWCELEQSGLKAQKIVLYKGVVIRGRFVSEEVETGLLETKIRFERVRDRGLVFRDVIEDFKGSQFQSKRLLPGRYRVTIVALNHRALTKHIELKEGQEDVDLGVLSFGALRSVVVTVLNENGKPVREALVNAVNRGVESYEGSFGKRTDENGRVRLNLVIPGFVNFYAESFGYTIAYKDRVLIPATGDEREVTLELTKKGGKVYGRCLREPGAERTACTLYLVRRGYDRIHDTVWVSVGEAFEFTNVPAGTYKIVSKLSDLDEMAQDSHGSFQLGAGERIQRDFYLSE